MVMGMLCSACAQAKRGPAEQAAVDEPAGMRVEREVAYGSDPAQRLDVYRPARGDAAPIVVLVHGGGWRRGDKAAAGVVKNKVQRWVPEGWIVVSVNYRLGAGVTPMDEADDVARALAFVQDKAKGWGGNPNGVVLMGHSAGGHLVALLAADPKLAEQRGAKAWAGTVVLDSAAYDVVAIMNRRHPALYDQAFGTDRVLWWAASPLRRLNQAPGPMLLVCSTQRPESKRQAEAFAAKATALGGHVKVLPVDLSHGPINSQLGVAGAYTEAVEGFMREVEGGSGGNR
jgi:acetyl esterase/lipase